MLKNKYKLESIGFSTVRDYSRYFSEYPNLLGEYGDLKDVQRPWALEQIHSKVKPLSKILDMGGGRPVS